MGVTLRLKQISASTLEILQRNPEQLEQFFAAQWRSGYSSLPTELQQLSSALPQSQQMFEALQQMSEAQLDGSAYRNQFAAEWEIPDLDLHKYFSELTYLLAGFIPAFSEADLAIPELQARPDLIQKDSFMEFFIIENSEWDGLPLVNAL